MVDSHQHIDHVEYERKQVQYLSETSGDGAAGQASTEGDLDVGSMVTAHCRDRKDEFGDEA